MRMWTGKGAFQWESSRKWDLNAGSEFCRGDGAVLVPAGLQSFSVFFRRASQSAGTFTLRLHTAPVYMQLLDSEITANNAAATLLPLTVQPLSGLEMTGTGARVYGARLDPNQAMGTILFWEVANSGSPGRLVGDIYLVPNHMGSITLPKFSRTVGDSDQGDCVHARVR
jgi:hypothetical protein